MSIYEFIGWFGALSYILAYLLLILRKVSADGELYHLMNALGGVFLVVNAIGLKDMPNFIVNSVWAIIAIIAILRILRTQKT